MKVVPVGKRILIKQVDAPETFGGGSIYIPEAQREKECKGVVIAIGIDVQEIEVGDLIQYADYITPTIMTHNGEDHLLIAQGEVLAILK